VDVEAAGATDGAAEGVNVVRDEQNPTINRRLNARPIRPPAPPAVLEADGELPLRGFVVE